MQETLIEDSLLSLNQQQEDKPMIELSPAQHLIDQVNGQGKYQVQSFFIFSFMWFLTSWLLLGMGFFFDSTYTCTDPQYSNKEDCQIYICESPQSLRRDLIASHASSIVFQFEPYLICQQHQTQVSVLQAMLFVGAMFGFFVIPYMADNYGRKLAMRVSWGIGTVAVMIVCIADSPNMIGLGLFLIGFGANPATTLCFSFINQICLGKSRARYGVGVQITWAFGETTVALIFATSLQWLEIAYILLVTFIIEFILIFLFIDQTPMFMLKKSSQDALNILNKMAKVNDREALTLESVDRIQKSQQDEFFEEQKSLGFIDLFRFKSIRWTSISAAFILFGIQVMYYSSQLNQNSVGFTITINQVIFGISQILGYIVAQILIHKSKRKKTTFIGLGISSGLCFVLGILVMIQTPQTQQTFKWVETAILMVSRFVLCSFWSIFYVYIAELYPTQIRSLGFGWTSVVGQIGSTISPFIKQISQLFGINSWFPTAIFGIISWFFIFCLHQTFGLPLRDEIEQRIQVLRKQKSELQIDYPDDDDDDYRSPSLPDINKDRQQLQEASNNLPKSSHLIRARSNII